jgi:hypothetical protein
MDASQIAVNKELCLSLLSVAVFASALTRAGFFPNSHDL